MAMCQEREHCLHGSFLSREPILNKHVETSGNIFATKGVLSTMQHPEKLSSPRQDSEGEGPSRKHLRSGEDSPGDRSPKRSDHDSSSRARDKHVSTWKDKDPRNLHPEEQSKLDPMIPEAQIVSRHNNQTDQQASTSSGSLECGELGRAENEQLARKQFIDFMKDLSPQTKDQSSQMLEHRFKSVLEHANPQTIIHFYRGTDQKHEFLRLLDDNRRQEVIDGLDDDEVIAHFDTLKTPDQRKEFLGCFNHDEIAGLYISLNINMQKNLVTGLDFKQIKALYDAFDLYRHRNRQKVLRYQEGIRYIIPFEDLKKLNDLEKSGLFPIHIQSL